MQEVLHEKFTGAKITVFTSVDTAFNQIALLPGEYINIAALSTNVGSVVLATESSATEGLILAAGTDIGFIPVGNANVYWWKTTTIGDKIAVHALRH